MTDLDSPETTIKRAEIIKNKKFLYQIYLDFYNTFKEYSRTLPPGKKVEIGSGAGFLKEVIPEVITSDVMKLPNCDMTFSAEKMPFKNNSISAFFMLNTFHHIKNPEKALSEFSRCLKAKGKIIMIEPYNSLWSRFIYKNFHHETFNPNAKWKTTIKGSLSGANGALPWIIFRRDRSSFENKFPKLNLTTFEPHTPIRYLISGGFTLPQILPNFLYRFVLSFETLLSPLNGILAMFVTIVLTKT
ncbi:MAG: type 11 methyltransferase [Candidatus Woesebacteria bacterium GW2011_GWA1_39_21b]|uniref:Type 11 methyltransferase n=2 Tax=Candidatus Woeseibacteriota TaxID=1752722 RepID=A0A0G0NET1_9BACT|nr:MAG: type 11 methyltransferase [Microgenomates group bacterium GW2011_GWC1_38_12]KKR14018.1 MAG: type 11 methyltransferase [Candidatus Woesebacteria bacterium GW2011_GWA1_39_21b]OGM65678.1 MAG: hypothetical protein A3A52_02200 [Candidatus Woesebacteria bacterium RIFCSPLOWO2_01_FULL_39_14]